MLKLNNNRDEDCVSYIDADTTVARETKCHSISFQKALIDCFTRGNFIHCHPYNALFMFQCSSGFHNEQGYPFSDFNILEHKEVWKQWLKAYMNDEATEQWANKTDILPKQFYNILYQYNMIIENVHFISDKAKVDVQKIHDKEMPSSYFTELKHLINSL